MNLANVTPSCPLVTTAVRAAAKSLNGLSGTGKWSFLLQI